MNKKLLLTCLSIILCTLFILPAGATVLKGDSNGDGRLATADYMRIKTRFKKNISMTESQLWAADVNDDGMISSYDYMMVKRSVVREDLLPLNKTELLTYEYENTVDKSAKLAIWGAPNGDMYNDDADLERLCQQYAELGITHVYNESEWGVVTLNRLMDCYEKYGLKSIIGIPNHDKEWSMRLIEATMNHPACWGYNMKDEPDTSQAMYFKTFAQEVRAVIPEDKMVTINLLPNVACTPDTIQNVVLEEYDRHVRLFLDGVKPDLLSFDHYPLVGSKGINSTEMVYYLKNLLEINTLCRDAGVEATSIIQSGSWGDARMPNKTELRFITNLNLVSGMDGITYFLYYSHPGFTGMVDESWTPRPIFNYAQDINTGIKKMKSVFKDYDQVGYMFTNTPSAYRNFHNKVTDTSPVVNSFGPVTAVKSSVPVLSGCFTRDDGSKALYVMNFSMTSGNASAINISFKAPTYCKIWSFDGLVDIQRSDALSLSLAPGEAVFIEMVTGV